MLKLLDAFAGIGGFHLAAEQACQELGIPFVCVAAIEKDKNAQVTYRSNFATAIDSDITKVNIQSLPDHDLLTGGFPCQPFSRNGKHYNKNNRTVGVTEDRAQLFEYLVKILEMKHPKFFVFENVPGILTMKGQDGAPVFESLLSQLRGAGYDTFEDVLDASAFVPQQRHRVYIVGIRKDLNLKYSFNGPGRPTVPRAILDILEPEPTDESFHIHRYWRNRKLLAQRPDKKNHSFSKGDDRSDAILEIYDNADKPTERTGDIESVAVLYGDTPSGLPRQQDKIYSSLGISPTIATFSTPVINREGFFRLLTPRECARLQGFPESYILPGRRSTAYKQIGNAVCVPVAKQVIRDLLILS